MGKKTISQQRKAANDELNWQGFFYNDNLARKKKEQTEEFPVDQKLYKLLFSKYPTKIRPIESFKSNTKNEERRTLEMARHLFCKFKVPAILSQAWDVTRSDVHSLRQDHPESRIIFPLERNPTQQIIYRSWYVTVGSGGSFHKECVKDVLTRKEAHTFLNCRHPIGIKEALIYSIAINSGAPEGLSLKLSRIKLVWTHLTSDFWRDVIRFFGREAPTTSTEADDIIDWITHKYNEDREFRISGHGYTIDSIRKKVKDWHYALRRAKVLGDQSWEAVPVLNFEHTTKSEYIPEVWTITQITNTKELAAEGTAQHHCVLSYKSRCISGDCSIWSMRVNGSRKVTIELLDNGSIVQCRGYANRALKPLEDAIIDRWAKENGLHRRGY